MHPTESIRLATRDPGTAYSMSLTASELRVPGGSTIFNTCSFNVHLNY